MKKTTLFCDKTLYLIIILVGLSTQSHAITFPHFKLPAGVTLFATNDSEDNFSAWKNKDEQFFSHKSNLWVRQISHVAKDKRLSNNDEWLLWVQMHKKGEGQRGFVKYKNDTLNRLQVIYHLEGNKVVLKPLKNKKKLNLTKDQISSINSIAKGDTYFQSIVEVISSKDFTINKEIKLDKKSINKYFYGDSGVIKLNAIKRMWEKDIAEFEVNTNFSKQKGQCKYNFWALKDSGRPVNLSIKCIMHNKKDGVEKHNIQYISRAFSYSDLAISTLAPKPLPALQPSGKILNIKFSDKTNQLLFLTKEHQSSNSWLTFWDLHQRKSVNTLKQGGETLLLSDNERNIYTFDYPTRSHEGWVTINNEYKRFGGVKPDFQKDRGLTDSDIFGVYPITINKKNEIEVWNSGYGKLAFRYKFKHSSPQFLSIAADGRLATADNLGNLYLHHFSIDSSSCNNDINSSYCNKPKIRIRESKVKHLLNLNFSKDQSLESNNIELNNIQLHPTEELLSFCSTIKLTRRSNCQLLNFKNNNFKFPVAKKIHFTKNNEIVTDSAIYNLSGKQINYTNSTAFFSPESSIISDKYKLLIHSKPNFNNMLENEIVIENLSDGTIIDTIQKQTYPINNIAIGEQNNLLYTSSSSTDGKVHILSLNDLNLKNISLPDKVLNIDYVKGWMFIKMSTASFVISLKNPTKPINLNFTINDYALRSNHLIYSRDNAIYRLNLDTVETTQLYQFDSPVHEFEVFNDDGSELVARIEHSKFSLPHINKILDLPYQGANAKKSLHYSDETQSFFISGLYGYTKSFNPQIETIVQFTKSGTVINDMYPTWEDNYLIASSSNGELWSGSKDGSITIRDIKSGILLEEIDAHKGKITDIKQLDKNTMVTSSSDGTMKLWRLNLENGKYKNSEQGLLYDLFIRKDIAKRTPKLISTIIVDKNDEFIINSPDGYYWSTPKALHNASFINDNKNFDYAYYDFWLNRPDIILQRLGKSNKASIKLWKKMVDFRKNRQPNKPKLMPASIKKVPFSIKGPDKIINNEKITLTYNVGGEISRTQKLHVLINQIPLYGIGGKTIHSLNGDIDITLTAGVNKIKAYIINKEGIQSDSQFLTYNMPTPDNKSNLYVLSIGVSDYINNELDLNYARKDAKDIAHILSKSAQYNKVHTKTIFDHDVTVSSITKAKEFISKAKPSDSVIVFFAGHGFLDKSNNYFFGTSDITPSNPEKNGLAYNHITGLLDGIPSRNKLLMLDTCHSGEVTQQPSNIILAEGVKSRGINITSPPRVGADLNLSFELLQKTFVDLRSSTGTIVISAAGGQEYALETDILKNGVFTASVIKALQNKDADTNKDGKVSISELRTFTYSEVARLTNGKQKPTTRNNNLDIDFSIY